MRITFKAVIRQLEMDNLAHVFYEKNWHKKSSNVW